MKLERRSEPWNPYRIAVLLEQAKLIASYGVFTGGWAWHFMSPPHQEVKSIHDHKDIDFFVFPDKCAELIQLLKENGYEKTWTKYDGITPNFIRYSKYEEGEEIVKVILDLFIEEVPHTLVKHKDDDFFVVEPATLITFYNKEGKKHSSEECVAVQAARKLVREGIAPILNKELVGEWGI